MQQAAVSCPQALTPYPLGTHGPLHVERLHQAQLQSAPLQHSSPAGRHASVAAAMGDLQLTLIGVHDVMGPEKVWSEMRKHNLNLAQCPWHTQAASMHKVWV